MRKLVRTVIINNEDDDEDDETGHRHHHVSAALVSRGGVLGQPGSDLVEAGGSSEPGRIWPGSSRPVGGCFGNHQKKNAGTWRR